MKKMKKLLFVFIIGLFLWVRIGIDGQAFTINLPEGAIEYASLETVPNVVNQKFGNFSLVQNYKMYEKTDSTDYYLRVYKAEKPVSLPLEKIGEHQQAGNGSIKVIHKEETQETTTYEEKLSSYLKAEYGTVVKSSCGIPLNRVTMDISATMSASLSTEVTKTTTLTVTEGTEIKFTVQVGPGFYLIQKRAIFQYYVIQKVGIVYNLIRKGNSYYRGSEKRYALFETIGQFVCQGEKTKVIGVYEYERLPNGIDLQIVTDNLTDKDYLTYF